MPKRYLVIVFAFTCLFISYLDRVNLSVAAPVLMKEYGWNPAVLGVLLSAFFWGFSVSPLFGGWLADRWGSKPVLGYAVLVWSCATVVTPMVFYLYGVLGLVWAGFWYALGASAPEVHPTISDDERKYVLENRGAAQKRGEVPWRVVLSCRPVWGLVATTFSVAWVVWLFISWLPTYLIETFDFSLKDAGIYSALPFVANTVGGIAAAWFQDRLIGRGVSVTKVRRTTLTVAFLGTMSFLFLIPNAPTAMHAVWYLTGAMGIFAAAQGTVMVNNIDIAPRYAGVILGLQATAGNLAGAISPLVAGFIVLWTGSFDGVFYLIVALLAVTLIVWNWLATGEQVIE